jgi:mannose-6-phosphate isomerase-like protein (cupin superfamily)
MRGTRLGWGILTLGMALLLGACARPPRTPAVLGGLPDGLEAFLASHPLTPGQSLRADRIERSRAASWHVVQVQGAEKPHRHRTHDLTVLVLRGAGVLTLDGQATPMRAGDAALVPRDRVHWFARSGDETAVALAIFTPPLDAPDSVSESGVDTMGDRR